MEKIQWREFSKETFQEAEQKDVPVLLSLSASWCHWCHVMDRTSYSDDQIVDYINKNFIPVRVDSDKRPDINERYNMGGWPTTAFLTPEGHLLTGGTYIPPEQFKLILKDIKELYQEQKPDLIQQVKRIKARDRHKGQPAGAINESIYSSVVATIKDSFDEEYGGFGEEPKFPMVDALELAAHQWLNFGDERCGEIFTKTLKAMSSGGMFDHEEGGFFRYSTTRDWSIPHFEKMLEDNAALIRLLSIAFQATGEESYAASLGQILTWMEHTLYLPETKCWAGSQDADEHYYSLSLPERKDLKPPSIDKNIYVNWNAQLAESLLLVASVLQEEIWKEKAFDTLASLENLCYSSEQGYAHYYDGEKAAVHGLLTDQVAVGRALAAAYQYSGRSEYLEKSQHLALWCIARLRSEDGGFLDSLPNPEATGEMSLPLKDLEQNSKAAAWLLLLYNLDEGGTTFKAEADRTLKSFTGTYRKHGLMASSYALAVYVSLKPWLKIEVNGDHGASAYWELARAALEQYLPNKAVILNNSEKDEAPKAYLCRGSQCYQPVTDSQELKDIVKRLGSEKI